jgi:hypothetical protein
MRDYSVEQVVRFEADPEEMEERVDALLGKLESHSAVASYGGTDLAIRLSVESDLPTHALREGIDLIESVLETVGLTWDLRRTIHIEITEHEALAEEIDEPAETFHGVTEVAQLLGVSKQRVSELRTSAAFPAPIAELAAGPVWAGSSLRRFVESWSRKPGRPRRQTPPDSMGAVESVQIWRRGKSEGVYPDWRSAIPDVEVGDVIVVRRPEGYDDLFDILPSNSPAVAGFMPVIRSTHRPGD